ncbi:hypothetical protein VDGL01_02268 [Verticillium dahliae]
MPYISDVGQPLLDQSQSFIVDTPQAASSSVKDNKISGGILLSEIEVEENSDWNVSLMIEIQRSSYELHVQPIGGSGPARRHTMKPSFESDERVSGGSDGGSLGGAGSKGQNEISVQGAFYKHGEGGSEERILEDQSGRMGPQRVKGIMRTTEVIVQ